MGIIKVGTAGWSYDDWIGAFYHKKPSSKHNWLRFYSEYFNLVEVNSSYYTYLSGRVVDSWLRNLENNEDFKMVIKLHQDFTHKLDFNKGKIDAVKSVLNSLKIDNRLAGMLIQFPYSFKLNRHSANYLTELLDIFYGENIFTEFRHSSWLNNRVFDFFSKNDITFIAVDQPLLGQAIEFNPIITNDTVYIRLHGRNLKGWKDSVENFGKKQSYMQQNDRYNYLYQINEMYHISFKVREMLDKVKQVFVILNNHPNGNAIANAFDIKQLLKPDDNFNIPQTTLYKYPHLKKRL